MTVMTYVMALRGVIWHDRYDLCHNIEGGNLARGH